LRQNESKVNKRIPNYTPFHLEQYEYIALTTNADSRVFSYSKNLYFLIKKSIRKISTYAFAYYEKNLINWLLDGSCKGYDSSGSAWQTT